MPKLEMDKEFCQDLLLSLCDFHERMCSKIYECVDMAQAHQLAKQLLRITEFYNEVERHLANLENRDPQLIGMDG